MRKLKLSVFTCFLTVGIFSSCNNCENTMLLVDLLYSSVETIAGARGYIVGEALDLRSIIKNIVAENTESCNDALDTEQDVTAYYETGSGWQRISNKKTKVPNVPNNGTKSESVGFVPNSPGNYLFEFSVDPDNETSESDESNNGNDDWGYFRSSNNVKLPKYHVIVNVIDPSNSIPKPKKIEDVKFEWR